MAARSPARSSAGPLVGVQARTHLVGDDARQARLAETGRAGEQHVVDGLAALLGRGQHDLEVLAQARLADELVEMPRPQRGLFGDLGFVGFGAEQLFSHAAAGQESQGVAEELFDGAVLAELAEHVAHFVVPVPETDERVAHFGARVRRRPTRGPR